MGAMKSKMKCAIVAWGHAILVLSTNIIYLSRSDAGGGEEGGGEGRGISKNFADGYVAFFSVFFSRVPSQVL